MTKSTSDRSSRLVLEVRRSLAAVASSLDILPLPTSFSRSLSANFKPLSIEACELSTNRTGTEAFCAATRAIPSPYGSQLNLCIHRQTTYHLPSSNNTQLLDLCSSSYRGCGAEAAALPLGCTAKRLSRCR